MDWKPYLLFCLLLSACAPTLAPLAHADDSSYQLPSLQLVADTTTSAPNPPDPRDTSAAEKEKSYILPAFEIVGFEVLLNLFNRNFASDHEDYETDFESIEDNLHGGWEFDRDSFDINQIGHPYQGSVYYTLARSAGLNFWESLGYTVGGSLLWEIAGETTKPSVNDQITTSVGGTYLGEALFRTAETFFKSAEKTTSETPKLNAAVVSPAAGFNREAFDKEVTPDLDKTRPILFREVQIGYLRHTDIFNAFDSRHIEPNLGEARFNIEYGLPGNGTYEYNKPFDYFNLDAALSTSTNDTVDHILVNGLLFGKDYDVGNDYRGVFGLYGSYNYLAPEIYRVGSSALNAGTTAQWWLSKSLVLQGTVLGGVGFGSGGTIHATEGGRDYHYGAVPQAHVNAKLIWKNSTSLDFSGQEFLVSGPSSDPSGSSDENISRLAFGMTTKVSGPHAVSLQYIASRRNAPFSSSPDQHQRVETVGIFYSYIWGGDFGARDWRR